MTKFTLNSAGVVTNEIDLSQPRTTRPSGIPAGIIGTSDFGPAFVPLTFGNNTDFQTVFGNCKSGNFGPIAVNEWLKNSSAVTFLRVLGAGDGKQRLNSGNVTNAGFTVGDQIVQANGLLGDNTYANPGVGAVKGRTYFLGCFMSESAGSTIFSDAGIQTSVSSSAILRGVLLAPSGVILHLSGTAGNNAAPLKTDRAASADGVLMGQKGGITGSVKIDSQEFVLLMNGYSNPDPFYETAITASFDMTKNNYFANVFNTDITAIEQRGHYLYSYYDIYPDMATVTGSGVVSAGAYSRAFATKDHEDIAVLLTSSVGRGLASSSTQVDYESFNDRFSAAKSPFVISQGDEPVDLFRIHALSDGEGTAARYKISIEEITPSKDTVNDPYPIFNLLVRAFSDTDEEPIILESFKGVNLDPNSDKYIGRVIGDQQIKYNFDVALSAQKLVVVGTHPVNSRYIRVEMSDVVNERTADASLLPFGFRGPDHLVTSGSLLSNEDDSRTYNRSTDVRSLVEMPIPYRQNIAQGSGLSKEEDLRLFWGVQTNLKEDPTKLNSIRRRDESFKHGFLKFFPIHRTDTMNFSVGNNSSAADVNGTVLNSDNFNNNKFTLENIKVRTGSSDINFRADPNQWVSASYIRKGGIVDDDVTKLRAFSADDLNLASNRSYAKFTFVLKDGFDGTNIFNSDRKKLTNNAIKREFEGDIGVSDNTIASYRKAVDILSSKTDVDIQLLAIPGVRHPAVTDFAISKVEERFDALYIMDIEEKDATSVITSSLQTPDVSKTIEHFGNRAPRPDTSFAAAYFPDVVIKNPDNPRSTIQVPPSVSVLGAYALNDKVGHPWFAPAGFTRGALNGTEPRIKLNQANLDDIYEADINPIASIVNIGTVVFGQKTLLSANSALDRVNVRRLLIDIRRRVKNVANQLLFEPNRVETLERFNALVNPQLQMIQQQNGIDRFKVVVDTTTTTQADVENNTIRGKIFLQPVRSIEFVSLDFAVTNANNFENV